jgi:two-component system sensor histidine kinase KdpD
MSGEIEDKRPTAEEMLERVRREAGAGARGRLRVYLGMAPGVGKTFAMLNEGRRRKERGTDVVIGYVETYNRPLTVQAIGDLEVIPRKTVEYKGVALDEMDTDSIIARQPKVALVDELAHTNAPGSRHEKRWEDVHEILSHGITVISTVNIQHLESLADIVETITAVPVRERIPDWVIDEADEVEVIDMSPHALRQRIKHGNVYPRERAEQALHSFFREGNLNALRELALRKLATTVEEDLEEYMRGHDIESVWPASDRVLVAVHDGPGSQKAIRRAWRLASGLNSELLAVFVETPGWADSSPEERMSLEHNLQYAGDLGADIIRVRGSDIARELAKVAREKNACSIVVGRPQRRGITARLRPSLISKLLEEAPDAEIHVVTESETN